VAKPNKHLGSSFLKIRPRILPVGQVDDHAPRRREPRDVRRLELAAALLQHFEARICAEFDHERSRAPLPLELREVRAGEVSGEGRGAVGFGCGHRAGCRGSRALTRLS
jgi:hypothetical protein